MAGTILAKLSATHQADNTTVTAANSGWSSTSIGSGNTQVHLDAAKMAASEGYRYTQGGANQNFDYLDLGSAQAIFAWRMPFRYAATPTANCALFRAFPATDHVTNLWTINVTTANRVQAVEGSPGTMNVTSASGSPLIPGSDYVALGLFNTSTGAFTLNVYPRASATALFSLTGTASAPQSIAAIRFGIGTASSLTQLDTNDTFAIGSGDFLDRADISNPLAVAPAVSPGSGPASTTFAFSANPTGGDGNAISYAWDFGDGGTGTGATPTHSYATPGTYTWSVTATQA